MEPPNKRQKLEDIRTFERSISPPPRRSRQAAPGASASQPIETARNEQQNTPINEESQLSTPKSPFQLTHIADLDELSNVDCVSLPGILGDPLLKEVWLFDFLFDLDFVMQHFDPDALVQVKIVHGSWKKESELRIALEEDKKKYDNVEVICAYMPEPFGTHHTKMMILFRQDDHAQVIIHTANMIHFDWTNMTQGAWLSSLLPLLNDSKDQQDQSFPIGSGERFKDDILMYFNEYKRKTEPLVSELQKYDFSSIRAAFVASAPTKHKSDEAHFGWPKLKRVLEAISTVQSSQEESDVVAMQVSSIATLSEKWMENFTNLLHTRGASTRLPVSNTRAKTKLVFPTVDDIRNSLNGYSSGNSIHLKGSEPRQQKQLGWLRSMFCRWSDEAAELESETANSQAMRSLAAPHIKTFVRYSKDLRSISWALLTSANLSTQAWGELPNKEGRVRISSWEVGVVVWPELFKQADEKSVIMVPAFGRDTLLKVDAGKLVVPLRLPYSLPFSRYTRDDQPWCKDVAHPQPDSFGLTWPSR